MTAARVAMAPAPSVVAVAVDARSAVVAGGVLVDPVAALAVVPEAPVDLVVPAPARPARERRPVLAPVVVVLA